MADPTLKARLLIDTKQAEQAVKKAGSNIANDAKKMAASFVGVTGAVVTLTQSIKQATSEYMAHEAMLKRIEFAGFQNVRATDAWADSLQRATGRDSDAILGLAALAKSFGVTEERARAMTQAALDMEAVGLMSADSGVRNLGKSLAGLSGELGEVVTEVRTLSKEALSAGDAIDLVARKYGGAAEKVAEASAWDAIKGEFTDIRIAALGLADAIADPAAPGGGSVVGALDKFEKKIQQIGRVWRAVSPFERFKQVFIDPWPIGGAKPDPLFGPDQVDQGGLRPESMWGVGDALPVRVVNFPGAGRPGVRDAQAELEFIRRYGPDYGARPGGGMAMPPAGSPFEQPRSTANDWLEEEARQREYIRDLTEQSMNTLTQSLLDSIFYARDLSDVFKNLLRDIAGSLVQTGVKSFVASIIPGAGVAMAGGGSYSIGPSDNNPALQQQARELSRQMNKSRRRGF